MSRETVIVFDHDNSDVSIFTTQEGVKNGISKRLGNTEYDPEWRGSSGAWQVNIQMPAFRYPAQIAKLLNPEEKTQMSEAQKAALRAAS